MFYPFFYDPSIIIIIPAMILVVYAQIKVTSTYNKYSRIYSGSGLTGAELARELLRQNNIYDVKVYQIRGRLTDHYDPVRKVLNLSPGVYASNSLAALGVAAHEVGHAIQHAVGYKPLNIRASLVPAANIGANWGLPMAIFGFIINSEFMIMLGLVLFAGALLFHLVTLPVEFNASKRAITLLERGGYLSAQELPATRKVLRAAAFTYVAATLVALANLLRILMLLGMRRRD